MKTLAAGLALLTAIPVARAEDETATLTDVWLTVPEASAVGREMIEIGRAEDELLVFRSGDGSALPLEGMPAGAGAKLEWNAAWERFRPAEYAATAGLAATAVAAELLLQPPVDSPWKGGILVDEAVRDALRFRTSEARSAAGAVSDAFLFGLIAYPIVVDAGIVAWGVHGSPKVAWQMLMIDLESFAVTASALALTKNLVGRERPYGRDCGGEAPEAGCGREDQNRSFFSGHTSMAFTGAGLTCTHHGKIPLYGGGAGDRAACVAAVAAAAATGVLRILADQHYASDVLTGAAIGTFSGFILPRLLHYGFGADEVESRRLGLRMSFVPVVGPSYGGAVVRGTFR